MTPPTVGTIGLGVLIVLLLCGMPIGYAMALIGFVGLSYLVNIGAGLNLLETIPYRTVASYTISLIPMFILMSEIAARTGITQGLYGATQKWLGHLRGGLAMATVGACAAFASICGSALAPAAMFARISLPEMEKYKYDPSLATGVVAAGGTLGILIPPSIGFVVYGFLTATSIGKLFIAGILPGVLLSALMMLTIYILCRRNPDLGPPTPKSSWRERLLGLKGVWETLVLFLLVLGGIYLGVFTPTEGGGIGAAGAAVIALVKRQLSWERFTLALESTLEFSAMVFVLLIGAYIFGAFMARSELPLSLAKLATESALSPYLILAGVLFFYFIMGCISDIISTSVLTLPIIYPMISAAGFDLIWFGVVTVIMLQVGLCTPPIGLNVFVVGGVAKHIPLDTIFRGVTPFVIAMLICIGILIAFPKIALILPSMMKGG